MQYLCLIDTAIASRVVIIINTLLRYTEVGCYYIRVLQEMLMKFS